MLNQPVADCRRRDSLRGVGLLALSAFAVTGCGPRPMASDQPSAPKTVSVKAVSVLQTEVAHVTTQPATIHAYHRAEVRANSSGYVEQLHADIGDVVESGATLAVIAVPEIDKQRLILEARIARYEAEEERAHAGISLAEADVLSSEARLAQARSELSRAEAGLAAAEAEFNRTDDLVRRQSLQTRVLDEVRMRRDAELANNQAVASAIDSADADVGVAKAKLRAAQADLRAATAETTIARRQLEELDVMIAYSTIKAPFAGVVTERTIEPGDLVREKSEVGAGQPLFVISQVDRVRVRIPVPEVDAAYVQRGDEVTLTFPFFPAEQSITGVVTRDSGSLDPRTRTLLVEAEIDNSQGKLLPGMFGQATISLGTNAAASTLPARAIRFSETGNAFVYVIRDDSTVSIANIATGIDDGQMIEVLSGVEPGQKVIDAHLRRFADGDPVEVLR